MIRTTQRSDPTRPEYQWASAHKRETFESEQLKKKEAMRGRFLTLSRVRLELARRRMSATSVPSMADFLTKKTYSPPSWASHLLPIPSHTFSLAHVRIKFQFLYVSILILLYFSLIIIFLFSFLRRSIDGIFLVFLMALNSGSRSLFSLFVASLLPFTYRFLTNLAAR